MSGAFCSVIVTACTRSMPCGSNRITGASRCAPLCPALTVGWPVVVAGCPVVGAGCSCANARGAVTGSEKNTVTATAWTVLVERIIARTPECERAELCASRRRILVRKHIRPQRHLGVKNREPKLISSGVYAPHARIANHEREKLSHLGHRNDGAPCWPLCRYVYFDPNRRR